MSTRGSFIMRKDGVDKELCFPYDAYPDGGGQSEPWNVRGVFMVLAATLAIFFVGQFTTILNATFCDVSIGHEYLHLLHEGYLSGPH